MKPELKKFFLSKKITLCLIIFFTLICLLSYPSVEMTSTVSFCGRCHEMEPSVESWRKSDHGIVNGKPLATCRDCHIPSWKNPPEVLLVKAEHGLKDIYHHLFSQKYMAEKDFYFSMKYKAIESTPNNRCTICHKEVLSQKEDIIETADGEVKGLHMSEMVKGLSCLMCHRHTGHTFYE